MFVLILNILNLYYIYRYIKEREQKLEERRARRYIVNLYKCHHYYYYNVIF